MIQLIRKYKLHYAVLLIFVSILLINRVLLATSYSIDIGGLEYYFIGVLQRMHASKELYPDPLAFPNANCLYTPLYFYILRICYKIMNIDVNTDIHKMLVIGRFFSIVLIFGQFYFISKIIKRFNASALVILLSFTLYILLISEHMFATRPDSLKILFFSAFVYYHIEYHFSGYALRNLFFSIICALLAVLSKQDIMVHIGICMVCVALVKWNKKILVQLLLYVTGCATLFGCLWLIYGQFVFINLFLLNVQTITNITKAYVVVLIVFSILRTLPFMLMTINNFRNSKDVTEKELIRYICLVSVLLFGLSHFFLLRAGANLNYTYELVVVLIVDFAIYLYLQKAIKKTNKTIQVVLLVIYLFLMKNLNVFTGTYNRIKEQKYESSYADYIKEKALIDSIVKQDRFFFPNTSYAVFYPEKNVIVGHDMHLDRFIELNSDVQVKSKLTFIDTKSFDNEFINGNVKYIIVDHDKKSIMHVQKYYPFYVVAAKTNHFLVYKFQQTKL